MFLSIEIQSVYLIERCVVFLFVFLCSQIFLENSLQVALFVNNKSDGQLYDVHHLLVPTSNITLAIIDKDNCHKWEKMDKINVAATMPEKSVAIFIINIEKFQFSMQGSVTITTSFLCSRDEEHTFLKYEVPVSLFDMLRPQAMDVAEFGDLWPEHGRETSDEITVISIHNADDICRIMNDVVNWRAVGVKDDDVLFAAVEVSQSELCLVWFHMKRNSNQLEMKIRVDDNSLSALLTKALKKLFSK